MQSPLPSVVILVAVSCAAPNPDRAAVLFAPAGPARCVEDADEPGFERAGRFDPRAEPLLDRGLGPPPTTALERHALATSLFPPRPLPHGVRPYAGGRRLVPRSAHDPDPLEEIAYVALGLLSLAGRAGS